MAENNRLCKCFLQVYPRRLHRMPHAPVTLEQVAAAAGVSISTASRALAGKARECRISQKTEQAILLAAQGLGFQASHAARSLRSRRSGLIGLLVPDASNPFFAAIARKATLFAERHGLSTLLADSHDSIQYEQDLLLHLQSRQVEGLIICSIGKTSEHLRALEHKRANVVVVDRWFADVHLPSVTSDNEIGAYIAVTAMIDKGHRIIGCLQGRPETSSNEERLEGLRRALTENDIQLCDSLICGDDFSEESGYRSTCTLLERHPALTAIFALSNQNALGALRALNERRLHVPQDVSLVMFDDAPFAEFLASPLSVVRQDVEAMGSRAAELLLDQIRTGQRPKEMLHRVPVEFVSRASIAPPRDRQFLSA
jgi:LacI family transcriptional regulator